MESDQEEEFFNLSEDLVQSPTHKPSGISTIDFDGLLSQPLRLYEDLAEGCGGQLWPAGVVLAKYMLRQQRHSLNRRSIVELGAGGGLVGLAVALGFNFNQPIIITDQKPMLALMERNIALNSLNGAVRAAVYDWGTPRPSNIPRHPDVILAADCVYFEPTFPLLEQTLVDLMGENTTCFFCFKKRRRADMQFIKAIKKAFNVSEVIDDPERGIYSRENIFLFKITKK